jgi:hypothetical protein
MVSQKWRWVFIGVMVVIGVPLTRVLVGAGDSRFDWSRWERYAATTVVALLLLAVAYASVWAVSVRSRAIRRAE